MDFLSQKSVDKSGQKSDKSGQIGFFVTNRVSGGFHSGIGSNEIS